MQVDPIKPTMKAPGNERLKLKHDEPPSKFAFRLNLRRYFEMHDKLDAALSSRQDLPHVRCRMGLQSGSVAGACTRPLFGST